MFSTEWDVEKKNKKTGIENYRVTGRLTLELFYLNMRFDVIKLRDYWIILPLF